MTPDQYEKIVEAKNLIRLQGASEETVKNAFFANYISALVLLKLQDLKGLMLINDPTHAKLDRFSPMMSDLNFWGRALFHSTAPEIKHRLMNGHADVLGADAGRVTNLRILKTMAIPMMAPEKIDWHDTLASLILYRERFDVTSSYFAKSIMALSRWESLSDNAKKRVVNDCFMYLLQSDPKSSLLPRMRALSNSVMINAFDALAAKLIGFKRLHEDGEATGTGSIGTAQGSSNGIVSPPGFGDASCDNISPLGSLYKLNKMAPRQVSKKSGVIVKDGKIIKKKVKGFKPRRFKGPDYLRATSSKKE